MGLGVANYGYALVGLLVYFQATIKDPVAKETSDISDSHWYFVYVFGAYCHFKLYAQF